MRKKKLVRYFKLLNPKNLAKEVSVYGYNFSWKTHVLTIICALLGISAIGVLYKLESVYFTIIIFAVCAVVPILILNTYKRMFEQKRFADAVTYAEQILYSFQKSGKAASALRETREIFEDGQMRWMIDDAIAYIETGHAKTENGVLREALEIIEKPYACQKIHIVHELIVSSEEYGGDYNDSILLLLNDIELWKRRGYKLQADKKQSNTDNIISIVIATVLCAVALYVLNAMGEMFPNTASVNIFKAGIIQISSFGFILFMLFVLVKSLKGLTSNWLQEEMLHPEASILSSYDMVMDYDDMKERKKSIIYSVPFFLAAIPALYYEKIWIAVGGISIAAVMLMQHRIGYKIAKKDINSELYVELPQWMMEIALLLQHNNVQVSIVKSIQEAPPLLKEELGQLVARLKEEPDRLSSYTDFCKKFDVPEVQSCMKMLHAISESGTGNAKVQINNLINRVHEMQNMADDIRNKNIAFRMKMLFSYPVMAATIKLLIDLTIGMIFMFQLVGSIGGV